MQVIGIRLANITGSNAVATLSWFSSGANVQHHLLFQHAVPTREQVWLPLEAFALDENDQIRVQAGTVILSNRVATGDVELTSGTRSVTTALIAGRR